MLPFTSLDQRFRRPTMSRSETVDQSGAYAGLWRADPRRAVPDLEARLIFELAHWRSEGGHPPDFRGISDWARLLQLASEENALIELRHCVRRLEIEAVPNEVLWQLAILSLERESRMLRLADRLEQLLVVLNGAQIDVMLLKGGALAATLYGSFAARPMRDIDILVKSDEADRVRTLMLELGWAVDPDLPGDGSYTSHHHLPPLLDPRTSGLRLEIHRSVLPSGHPFRFTDDEIWNSAQPMRVGAGRALAMHPLHHAVHIAIHLAWSHMMRFGAWNAFRDLDALAAARAFDWSNFTETARRWGASTCGYWTLRLARTLSGLTVPNDVMLELRPELPEVVARPLARHFVNGLLRAEYVCPSVRLTQLLWNLAIQPKQCGHGARRPWLMSLDLLDAFRDKAHETEELGSESPFALMGRSGRYISQILT